MTVASPSAPQRWGQLLQRRGRPTRVGLTDATDERVIEAVARLSRDSVVQPVLLGDPALIKATAARLGVPLPDAAIWPLDDALDVAGTAARLEAVAGDVPGELA